jgi:hypothetical protein
MNNSGQVAVSLLDMLGYSGANRSEQFPIYGFEGSRCEPSPQTSSSSVEKVGDTSASSRACTNSCGW